jgi:cytochrome P450 family 135
MSVAALPPGPPTPLLTQTARFWRRPEPMLHAARARYGDVFTLRVLPRGPVVFIADPALVKQVFTGPTDLFHAGEGNALLEPVMGPRSVLLLDEDEHLRRRKLMLPAFHGENVRRLVGTMRELAAAEVDRWPLGRPFALLPRTNALTLEVILRTVFGVHEEARLQRLRDLLPRVVDVRLWLMPLWIRPGLGRLPPWRGWVRAVEQVDAVLLDEIAQRRRAPDLDERSDVLSMLVTARDADGAGLDDRELRDQLMTLLLAGHETTATGLAWAFERILRDPRVEERVWTAAAEDDDAYLDAVVKEVLRVRPVIDRVGRMTTREVQLGEHHIPARTQLCPAIGLIGLDPAHHPDAFAFRPERWLEGDAPGGTRGCRSAAACGAASAPRSPRPRCARSCASSVSAPACASSARPRSASSAATSRSCPSAARASSARRR